MIKGGGTPGQGNEIFGGADRMIRNGAESGAVGDRSIRERINNAMERPSSGRMEGPDETVIQPRRILDTVDFRVDSNGWDLVERNGLQFRVRGPRWDIFEIVSEGPYHGIQYFTQDAAREQAAEAGKLIPSQKEWLQIILDINPDINPKGFHWQKDDRVMNALGLMLGGYYDFREKSIVETGLLGAYWTSSDFISIGFKEGEIHHELATSSNFAKPVRCWG